MNVLTALRTGPSESLNPMLSDVEPEGVTLEFPPIDSKYVVD